MQGYDNRIKQEMKNCILTGYYSAYYNNSGKKAKTPNELIGELYKTKQSFKQGLIDIERVKELERRSKS